VSYYYNGSDWVLLGSITIDPALTAVQSTGTVTIDNLVVTGTLTADVDVTFDTDTFFVDSDLNRVGINQQNPSYELDVTGTGRFTSGIIGNLTGNVTGNVTGNASTATTLQTARTITIDGDVDGSASFDGSENITITTTVDDNSHDHSYVPLSGGTMTGELQVNARLDVGNGTNGDHEIRIYKGDNNVSDHIQFFNGTTRVGEIGAEDNTWLRINQETAKNIYTPRYIRADAGFFVDGSTYGITGSGAGYFNGTVEAVSGDVVVTRPNSIRLVGSADANHQIYSLNAADTSLPWSDGVVLRGYSGWAFYHSKDSAYRMGYRGSNTSTTQYGWYNSNLIVGSAPNDAINTHRLRVQGDGYFTGNAISSRGTLSRVTPCTSIDRVHDTLRTSGGTYTVTLGTTEGGVSVSGATGVFLTVTADSYNGNSGYGEVKPYGQGTTVNGSCMNWDVGNTSQAGIYVSLDSSRRFRYYLSAGARVIIDVTGFTF
jgi:hypothetical protein